MPQMKYVDIETISGTSHRPILKTNTLSNTSSIIITLNVITRSGGGQLQRYLCIYSTTFIKYSAILSKILSKIYSHLRREMQPVVPESSFSDFKTTDKSFIVSWRFTETYLTSV